MDHHQGVDLYFYLILLWLLKRLHFSAREKNKKARELWMQSIYVSMTVGVGFLTWEYIDFHASISFAQKIVCIISEANILTEMVS